MAITARDPKSIYANTTPDCERPGICPFGASHTWCEKSAEHGKVSVKILRWLCGLIVLVILAMATGVSQLV
jgi:hypothetical protein